MLPVLGMGRPRARSHVFEGDSRDGCPWPVKHCAPMTAPDPDALVPLTACPDSQTAALLKAKLEGAGLMWSSRASSTGQCWERWGPTSSRGCW